MSIIHKMIESSVEEISTAEKYIKLAKKIEDPSIAVKLQEIAKDELRHCEFFQSKAIDMIKKMSEKSDTDCNKIDEDIEMAFFDVYEDWKDKVTYMVDTFEVKR